MLYLKYNQLFRINQYKFNSIYLSRLNKIVSIIYNKNVEFNIVNLKYVYLDSSIFSESVLIKIKNRKKQNKLEKKRIKQNKLEKTIKQKKL